MPQGDHGCTEEGSKVASQIEKKSSSLMNICFPIMEHINNDLIVRAN